MKKSDLKDGMVIETREGKRYLVLNAIAINENGWINLQNFNEDMTHKFMDSDEFDITKVFYPVTSNVFGVLNKDTAKEILIWERRKQPVEVTMSKLEELLGYPVKIVKEEE